MHDNYINNQKLLIIKMIKIIWSEAGPFRRPFLNVNHLFKLEQQFNVALKKQPESLNDGGILRWQLMLGLVL